MSQSKLRTITSARAPDPDMIAMLENLLARAKEGELTDLVCIWTTLVEYDFDWVCNADRYAVAGYMIHVQNKIAEDPDSD